ncbi:hypothetical protein, variant 2 [Aphanomyces invadans]|uniref:Aquaporin n=1 Tax=Aphanomyces invadans TaxID=157072 RepID=A0A024UEG8_9STRA|nr:hypothetical protein, variant 2 [Aphanomyces invadans]ETW04796.1 hypothetical protein, variant 2 [Aphanomyces invadans]|eukprot:XP_008866233.1 hypothetical protein, variant 2 [Aphanomyces invadans]
MTGVVPTDDDDQPLRPDNSTFDTITLPLSTTSLTSILHARCRVASSLGRECMSEFFATFVMMGFGTGSGAQVALSNGQHGNYTHITLCWGIAVMLGIHIGGAISGAHMNPAVSFTWCVLGKFPWMKLPWYCISQVSVRPGLFHRKIGAHLCVWPPSYRDIAVCVHHGGSLRGISHHWRPRDYPSVKSPHECSWNTHDDGPARGWNRDGLWAQHRSSPRILWIRPTNVVTPLYAH